jgi:hypothetical protein
MSEKTPLPAIITLSLRIYRFLLRLGPAAYRQEYEESTLQVFRQCCRDAYRQHGTHGVLSLWLPMFFEAITGMLAELAMERMRYLLPTMRRSIVATFGAFVLFVIACIALERTADPRAPFEAVAASHPDLALAFSVSNWSASLAFLVIILGGLPILFTAVKHAGAGGLPNVVKLFVIKPKQALLLLGAALLITICFLGYILATELIFGSPCRSVNGCGVAGQSLLALVLSLGAIVAVITLIVFVILAIMASLSLAVFRSEFNKDLLRFSLVPTALLTLIMSAGTLATIFWLIRLWMVAPQFAASGSGLGNGQTAWVVSMIAAMAVSTLITAGALVSGIKVNSLRDA